MNSELKELEEMLARVIAYVAILIVVGLMFYGLWRVFDWVWSG